MADWKQIGYGAAGVVGSIAFLVLLNKYDPSKNTSPSNNAESNTPGVIIYNNGGTVNYNTNPTSSTSSKSNKTSKSINSIEDKMQNQVICTIPHEQVRFVHGIPYYGDFRLHQTAGMFYHVGPRGSTSINLMISNGFTAFSYMEFNDLYGTNFYGGGRMPPRHLRQHR